MRRGATYRGDVTDQSHGDNRADIRACLATRRTRLTAAEVGPPPGSRRRVPGLRREGIGRDPHNKELRDLIRELSTLSEDSATPAPAEAEARSGSTTGSSR